MLTFGTKVLVTTVTQKVYLIDVSTGSVKWVNDLGYPEGLAVDGGSRAVYRNGTLYVGTTRGTIVAIGEESGNKISEYMPDTIESGSISDMVGRLSFFVRDYIIFTRYDGVSGALRVESNGSLISVWTDSFKSATTNLIRNGVLYIGDIFGQVTAYDPLTGKKLWASEVLDQPIKSLIATENIIFSVGFSGRVSSVGIKEGKLHWTYNLDAEVSGTPQIREGKFYIVSKLGNVYGFDFK